MKLHGALLSAVMGVGRHRYRVSFQVCLSQSRDRFRFLEFAVGVKSQNTTRSSYSDEMICLGKPRTPEANNCEAPQPFQRS